MTVDGPGERGRSPAEPVPVPASVGKSPTIATLTGIRALAAGWVVLFHFGPIITGLLPALAFLNAPMRLGFLGVEVFFILSGFIIAYNYAEKITGRPAYGRYLWARVSRIYPVHALTVVIPLALIAMTPRMANSLGHHPNTSPRNVVGNLLMLQAVPGFWGINGPAWSVSCEMAAYLVFPLLAWVAVRISPRTALGCAAAVVVCGAVVMNIVALAELWSTAYRIIWLRIGTEFTAGVLLWVWWRARPRTSMRWDYAAIASVVVIVIASFLTSWDSPRSILLLPVIALFVVSCASAAGPLARLLSSRAMQWGGRVSYSLYLGHSVIYLVVGRVIPWEAFIHVGLAARIGWVVVMAIWIAGTAAALYHFVEEPARKALLKRSARAAPTGAHSPAISISLP